MEINYKQTDSKLRRQQPNKVTYITVLTNRLKYDTVRAKQVNETADSQFD